MRTNLYLALASCVVVVTLIFAEPAAMSADHEAHQQKSHNQASKHARRAKAKRNAKRKARRRAVIYVCPMHPDIREKSAGTCPKCLMDLVAEPRRVMRNPKHTALF